MLVPSSYLVRALWTLAVLLALAFLAFLFYLIFTLSGEVHHNEDRIRQGVVKDQALQDQNDLQDQALAEANRRLKKAGEAPVPTPTGPTVIEGPQGLVGLRGATGPAGPRGAQGPKGDAGIAGEAGAPGETGPAGTDGASGIAGPQGETGPQGPAGADGKDGRGIESMSCDEAGTWVVHYTDGTTQTVAGSECKKIPGPPEPEPTGTP